MTDAGASQTEDLQLRPFTEYTRFTELFGPSKLLPEAPRFVFGGMPADVSASFFGRRSLPAIGLFELKDMTIGEGFVLVHEGMPLVAPELNLQAKPLRDAIRQWGVPAQTASITALRGTYALITGPGYKIYGHWLAEILPKLAVLQLTGHAIKTTRFLIPADTPAFALEFLSLLGIEEAQLVRFGGKHGSVRLEKALLPSFLHNAVRYSEILVAAARLLREAIENNCGRLAQGGYPRRVMLIRQGGPRPLVNRGLIEAVCVSAGFTLIAPESMPIIEQLRMFADATEILGEYGSALHGSLFSAPGTVVCGLRGSEFHPAFIQSGFGQVLAQPTGYVFGVTEEKSTGRFALQLQDVQAFLDTVVSPGVGTGARAAAAAASHTAPSAQSLVDLHDELAGAGEWDAALRIIRQALALEPDRADAHSRRAVLLARNGAPAALQAVSRAISLGDKSAANLALKAEILAAAGRSDEAFDAGMAAARAEPDNASMHDLVARLALHGTHSSEGLAAANRAVELAPNEPRYKLALLDWYLRTSDLDRAEALAKEIHAMAPKMPGAAVAYAKVLVRRGDIANALSIGLESLGHSSADPELRHLVSILLDGNNARGAVKLDPAPPPSRPGETGATGNGETSRVVIKEAFSIDFSIDGGSAAYRLAGWAHPETTLVWGIGARSTLLLPALDANRDWNIAMTVSGCFAGSLVPKQTLRVLVNGVLVGDHAIYRQSTIKVFVPKDILSGSGGVFLEFDHPDHVSPRSLGKGNDDRQLAIAFFRIRFSPINS